MKYGDDSDGSPFCVVAFVVAAAFFLWVSSSFHVAAKGFPRTCSCDLVLDKDDEEEEGDDGDGGVDDFDEEDEEASMSSMELSKKLFSVRSFSILLCEDCSCRFVPILATVGTGFAAEEEDDAEDFDDDHEEEEDTDDDCVSGRVRGALSLFHADCGRSFSRFVDCCFVADVVSKVPLVFLARSFIALPSAGR